MNSNDIKLLEDSFKGYYFNHFEQIRVPDSTREREFGYQKFDSGMIRHLSVKNDKELHLLLISNVPSDVYSSNAYYSFPNLPMAEKDWKGADLIFDIDSKDLNLTCRKNHTLFKCRKCQAVSDGNVKECGSCSSTSIESKSLACNNCIDGAKKEVAKLSRILMKDFDVKREDIQVYFSGNEGFHVYVSDPKFQVLESRERSEIADYLMFRGVLPDAFGFKKFKPRRENFPELDEPGWRGRVAKEFFGSKSRRSKEITEILSGGYVLFGKRLASVSEDVGVKIDPNVTMDVHRIFRLPGSLNSKSGLAKSLCEKIDSFNPFRDACFIDEASVDVVVSGCPIQFRLKNKKFGPFSDAEKTSLPKYAAVYMICKGLASIA